MPEHTSTYISHDKPFSLARIASVTGNPMLDLGLQCEGARPFFRFKKYGNSTPLETFIVDRLPDDIYMYDNPLNETIFPKNNYSNAHTDIEVCLYSNGSITPLEVLNPNYSVLYYGRKMNPSTGTQLTSGDPCWNLIYKREFQNLVLGQGITTVVVTRYYEFDRGEIKNMNYINKWCKFKPTYDPRIQGLTGYSQAEIAAGKDYNEKENIFKLNADGTPDDTPYKEQFYSLHTPVDFTTVDPTSYVFRDWEFMGDYSYRRPSGDCWHRMTDFCGYNAACKEPIRTWFTVDNITEGEFTFHMAWSKTLPDNNITIDDLGSMAKFTESAQTKGWITLLIRSNNNLVLYYPVKYTLVSESPTKTVGITNATNANGGTLKLIEAQATTNDIEVTASITLKKFYIGNPYQSFGRYIQILPIISQVIPRSWTFDKTSACNWTAPPLQNLYCITALTTAFTNMGAVLPLPVFDGAINLPAAEELHPFVFNQASEFLFDTRSISVTTTKFNPENIKFSIRKSSSTVLENTQYTITVRIAPTGSVGTGHFKPQTFTVSGSAYTTYQDPQNSTKRYYQYGEFTLPLKAFGGDLTMLMGISSADNWPKSYTLSFDITAVDYNASGDKYVVDAGYYETTLTFTK